MKKLALLILLFVLAGASAQAQNIVKSLERNVPGQGKVTIHQDPRIEAMIGMERLATGEQKVMKGSGFRIQAYALSCVITGKSVFPGAGSVYVVQSAPLALSCG